jgi:hypothetical protein
MLAADGGGGAASAASTLTAESGAVGAIVPAVGADCAACSPGHQR